MSLRSTVERIIDRGIAFDAKEQYTAAYASYQEALRMITDLIKGPIDESTANYMQTTLDDYTKRLDTIQTYIAQKKDSGQLHEQYHIEDKSTGNSYKTIFGRFLDDEVQFVIVEDPNIQDSFQFQNLIRLCELLVQKCLNLKYIKVITLKNMNFEEGQRQYFLNLTKDLSKRKVKLYVKFIETLDDMKITLNSGWIIKLSRGLDIYKPWDNIFSIGVYDLDLRPCHDTIVDIYHSKNTRTTNPVRNVP